MPGRIQITIIVLLVSVSLFGQIEYPVGKPLFPSVSSWYDAGIDQSQIDLMRSIDQPKDQPFQFAIPFMVSLKPGNAGFTVSVSGETVWVMPVSSKGALSLNVILEPFNLPKGAYVYIYDEKHEVIRGAFTDKSGNNSGSLPLLPVPGDKMVIECHFPGSSIPKSAVGIRQVAHDFAGFFGMAGSKDLYYGLSGLCEVDISCSTNQNYLRASRSVCRLLVTGTELCTGILVNNTGQDYKAYILTAQHCIQNTNDANNTIFVFNYASPWCDGPDQGNMHSISGSLLRASNEDIDFSLVELSSFPSLVFKPYFAGWDITATIPANSYTIHHPEGDIMKISIDDNPPVSSSYPAGSYVSNGFWRIFKWDMGTTESGSSGCPLFDQNSRLRGTLTGGAATCSNPVDDYFAKLSRMFTISTVSSSNLKPWLDPAATGATLVSGRDPYSYNLSLSDTLKNFPENDPGQTDLYSPGYGYSTGTNSDSLIRYAEYIPFSGTGEIAWVHLNIAYSSFLASTDSIRVFVWSGGTTPGTVIASRLMRLQEVKDNYDLEVDFGRTIAVNGPFYVGYRVYYEGLTGSPQSQFAVLHSQTYAQESLNTAWIHDGISWKPFTQHPSYPKPVSLAINVIMVENSVLNPVDSIVLRFQELTVFPNPFSHSISFGMSDSAIETSLTVYDNTGRVISSTQYRNAFPGILTIELPSLPSGIYHFLLINDSVWHSGSIIKMNAE